MIFLKVYWKQSCLSLSRISFSCPSLHTSLLFNEISLLNASTLFRNIFVLLPFPFRLAVIRDQVIFAVQQEYVLLGDQLLVLQTGDEVAIIPPISGGWIYAASVRYVSTYHFWLRRMSCGGSSWARISQGLCIIFLYFLFRSRDVMCSSPKKA